MQSEGLNWWLLLFIWNFSIFRWTPVLRQHAAECRLCNVFCWQWGNSTAIGSTWVSSREGIKSLLQSSTFWNLYPPWCQGGVAVVAGPAGGECARLSGTAQAQESNPRGAWDGAAHLTSGIFYHHTPRINRGCSPGLTFKCCTCTVVGKEDRVFFCAVGKGDIPVVIIISKTNLSNFKKSFLHSIERSEADDELVLTWLWSSSISVSSWVIYE